MYEALSQFYFRSKKQWCASGKSIVRYLKNEDPQLALEFTQSFDKLFQTGETIDLEKLTEKILMPFGGLFWNGFQSYAPKDSRSLELNTLSKTIEQPKVKKSSPQTKTVHLSGIYDYINFTKIDSRIIHDGLWKEGYPMQTTIEIPAKHHDEIMAKVEKAIAATKPNQTVRKNSNKF